MEPVNKLEVNRFYVLRWTTSDSVRYFKTLKPNNSCMEIMWACGLRDILGDISRLFPIYEVTEDEYLINTIS